jgi:DNA polymerase III sliding clamp (beta) subunit (PCNA family)
VEVKLDWDKLEEVVERAVRKARTEELKDVAETLKMLAEYMKTGFEATNKALEGLLKAVEEL